MEVLGVLIFALSGGLIMSRVVKFLHLPNVTGYLIAGLILGGHCLKLVDYNASPIIHDSISTITSVALGFIAFSIGGEFKIEHLKKLGSKVLTITVVQAVFAVGLTMLGLFVLNLVSPGSAEMPVILLLGAISAATAPAATLMVVRQYKAKGPVTDTLLPVVAGDDAIGLMIFAVCLALAKVFATGEQLTVQSTVLNPLREIALSLIIGAAIGTVLALSMKFFLSRANRICLMILAVLAGVVLSDIWELSSLLTCMMIGALFANIRNDANIILEGCERWTPPVFMLFFVFSGAELDITVLPKVGVIGIVYLLCRSIGKYFGAFAGAVMVHDSVNVRNYLGVALLPQAGVAIGMAQMVSAMPELSGFANSIVTVTLSATLIYELIGPVLTKISLTKAGEIQPAPKPAEK